MILTERALILVYGKVAVNNSLNLSTEPAAIQIYQGGEMVVTGSFAQAPYSEVFMKGGSLWLYGDLNIMTGHLFSIYSEQDVGVVYSPNDIRTRLM